MTLAVVVSILSALHHQKQQSSVCELVMQLTQLELGTVADCEVAAVVSVQV